MYDEVRDAFSDSSAQLDNLTLREEGDVSEGHPDSKLQLRFVDPPLPSSGFCEEESPAWQGTFCYSFQPPEHVTKVFSV